MKYIVALVTSKGDFSFNFDNFRKATDFTKLCIEQGYAVKVAKENNNE